MSARPRSWPRRWKAPMGAREMIHRTSLCVGAQVQSPVLYAPLALPGAALENQQLSESPQNEFCFWMKSPDFSTCRPSDTFFVCTTQDSGTMENTGTETGHREERPCSGEYPLAPHLEGD